MADQDLKYTIIIRARGKGDSGLQQKLGPLAADDLLTLDLVELEHSASSVFSNFMGHAPIQVGSAVLPYIEEQDGDEDDA